MPGYCNIWQCVQHTGDAARLSEISAAIANGICASESPPFEAAASTLIPTTSVSKETPIESQRREAGRCRFGRSFPYSQSSGSGPPRGGESTIRKTTEGSDQLRIAGVPVQVSVPAGVLGPLRQQATKDHGSASNIRLAAASTMNARH